MSVKPFDIIKDVSSEKHGLVTAENERDYQPWLTNKAFSFYTDTIFNANLMNMNAHLDPLLQHDYYMNALRKRKRFSKWPKKAKSEAVDDVAKYYNYSPVKAAEACKILTEEQIRHIQKMTNPEDT